MAAVNVNRVNAPQAFVSSFAPRIRQYGNSLLTPVIPQSVVPNVRTTKRGTTAINYAEEFDEDSIEDSDNPRRATGLRTAQQRRDVDPAVEKAKELGKEATAPVEVQGIWRDWMGKPKRTMTERQLYLQAVLPTTLVPIRIDLDVAPFRPDAALPTPANAKDFGIDENLPAYKAPDVTPSYRLKDSFLWNLHEGLITPDMFAKVFVDELDFPVMRKQTMIAEIAQQIRQQLEEHAAAALHPLFQPQTKEPTAQTAAAPTPSLRHAISREDSSTPMQADTPRSPHPNNISLVNGHHSVSGAQTPLANGTSTPAITVTAQRSQPEETTSSVLNPPDTHRCVLNLSINLQNRLYTDKFEWSLQHPVGFAEIFAKRTCADIGLPGEWVPQMAHAIYESSLRLKKDMIDNNSTLAGVVGSGVDGWGVVDNEACEYHGTAESALGVGAGWRFDEDGLGYEWEPRIEVLNKEEIEKREGDRERQIRRQRRETARFTTNYAAQAGGIGSNDFFAGGLGASQGPNGIGGGEDERMGRGERSKKKRRFRSLSPVGRETPEAAGFGGTSAQLTEGERQYWTCSHCNIWGQAVWGVRDGPKGPRVGFVLARSAFVLCALADRVLLNRLSATTVACCTNVTNASRRGVIGSSLSRKIKLLAKPNFLLPGRLNNLQRVHFKRISPLSQLRKLLLLQLFRHQRQAASHRSASTARTPPRQATSTIPLPLPTTTRTHSTTRTRIRTPTNPSTPLPTSTPAPLPMRVVDKAKYPPRPSPILSTTQSLARTSTGRASPNRASASASRISSTVANTASAALPRKASAAPVAIIPVPLARVVS
jgi:chromatin structure-remodeling complex subunit SFH1